jgi:peroxiredoxin
MKNYRFVPLLALSLIFTAAAIASGNGNSGKPSGISIGQPVADFTLSDVDGKEHSLASLKGKNGTVIIFLSAQCPVVRAYNERIEKLAEDYRARGVNVVGINSNVTESLDDIKHHINDNKFSFVVLRDTGSKVADLLDAQHTPETFFLDASNKLVYHGRIDNNRNAAMVQSNDLRDAIDATLSGKPVAKTEAAAFGCSIKRG